MLTTASAQVKYPAGRTVETKYGSRINVVLTLPNGEDVKLWSNPDDQALTSLRKGQAVQVAQGIKGGWQLLQTQENGVTQNQSHSTWTNEDKKQIAAKVTEHAKLMKYCLEQAKAHCGEYLETSEDLRAIATTLFLSVTRR
ncbi:MAG: hypothetical protein F6K58_19865 [Symploca sp. SIO2E9]|nr:hypothetical protein [Symploca sp. SIO2E9]